MLPNRGRTDYRSQEDIVDITGNLPTILLEIEPAEDPADSSLKKTYIYADSQIIAQHDGDRTAAKYFYLHDRLGSVRLVIDDDGDVQNTYTYEPFGEMLAAECAENISNPFKFTGQYFDAEIDEYYLRARQYNPALARFTARDPVFGEFQQPLTLHKYLYCANDPINRADPTGRIFGILASAYTRGKDAVASMGAKTWAEEVLIGAVSLANGLTQGSINMLFGPDDMSDNAKFWVGFTAGFGETQIGMRTGSAKWATTLTGVFLSGANSVFSSSTDFFSVRTAINTGLNFAAGHAADFFGDGALDAVTLWTMGVAGTMSSGVLNMAVDLAPEP